MSPARRTAPKGSAAKGSKLVDALGLELKPQDRARAKSFLADLAAEAKEARLGDRLTTALAGRKELGPFLAAIAEVSPYLRSMLLADPARLLRILAEDPRARLDALIASLRAAEKSKDEAGLMENLRRDRGEAALLVALADLGGVWDVVAVTDALTLVADAAVGASVNFLLREAEKAGSIKLPDKRNPGAGSGWILLAMGKYGAGELNYSSDIDLIVLFENEAPLAEAETPSIFWVKLTRRLVRILQERTADGYVFRTDLRLRPDPGATAIAISVAAALQYYESQGQNWERAALIKARAVAGDIAAGESFLGELTPYIWRKYLDYAAIADIHSIKRQIHDHRGHAEVAVAGHNIKLGRGGIREVEFFVQTQQLIAGGRDPALRGRRTLDMLDRLAATGWIAPETAADMARCYKSFRSVEHRLQMIADDQTHTLPEEEAELTAIARLSGFKTVKDFETSLRSELETVRQHYSELFEAAPTLSSSVGSLVFTGDDDDPDTLATLSRLGFTSPSDVARTIRSWHFGRYPSTRSATARERLTEFMPALLEALSATDNADAAFASFDRFLQRLPAGVQLFALIGAHPDMLGLLAGMMGTAPRLAEIVTAHPHVLDALIDPAFFGRVPDQATLEAHLKITLGEARSFEDALDRARIFGQEQRFLIGVRQLAGTISPRQAGISYAELASILVAALLQRVEAEFRRAHGKMPKGGAALLALGRLGGLEMSASSDLDLILLYDFDAKATSSDGQRPLPGSQYYARLTQRLVSAITAPTNEGTLYEVDFRLRPSGHSGPLATHVDAFADYQAKSAWTWEQMALTRARAIAGDPAVVKRAAKEVRKVLTGKRDRAKLKADILDMRSILEAEKGAGDPWDLKQARGGLVDIEFVAQFLQLAEGKDHPEILDTRTEAVLERAAEAKLLPKAEADVLLPALRLYQALFQVLRLCLDGPFDLAAAPRGLLELLARAADLPNFKTLDASLRETQKTVRASFERVIGKVPAKPKGG